MLVKEILDVTGGRLLCGNARLDINLSKTSTDSRCTRRASLFVGLSGPNYNGSLFAAAALDDGACAAIVNDGINISPRKNKAIIFVKDTTLALGDIARAHRRRFLAPIIAVTGSTGKTTTKEMIWSVLSQSKKVLKNEGTKNNNIGLPLTLLKLDRSYKACVVELGTNHPGEIEYLSGISLPDVVVMTNIGPSHLEFFGDLNGVFKAKIEILKYARRGGTLIINGDDRYLNSIRTRKLKIIRYGFGRGNDVRGSSITQDGLTMNFMVNGEDSYNIGAIGHHNVSNALASIAVGRLFGVTRKNIAAALSRFHPSDKRLTVIKSRGIDILDDSYNSNPLSMRCALDALKNYPAGAKWVVAADMLELGDGSARMHKEIGEYISSCGFNGLFTYGPMAGHIASGALDKGMSKKCVVCCSSREEIAKILRGKVKRGDAVLVKGSRSMKMDEIVEHMKRRAG